MADGGRRGSRRMAAALAALLVLSAWPAALAHDHEDIPWEVVWYGYVAPTEYSDGTTGPGTCSVCGAEVEPASVIPRLASQRGNPDPEPPVQDPEPAPEAPEPEPAQAPEVPAATPVPEPVQAPEAPAATPVPERISAPEAPAATPVPEPVRPASGNGGGGWTAQATPQPDLSQAAPRQSSGGGNSGGGNYSSGGGNYGSGGRNGGGGGSTRPAANPAGGSVFSLRFPWRRLRMNPRESITVRPAGILLWPMPEASTPLMNMLH